MADLDSLQIQITASTSKADTAIKNLVTSLGNLNNALSGSANYVNNLNSLTAGLSGFRYAVAGVDTAKIKEVSNAMRSLANAGTKLSGVGTNGSISKLASDLQALNAVNISSENVSNVLALSNSIGKLGGKGATAAVSNLPKIAQAISAFNNVTLTNTEGIAAFGTAVRGLGTKSVVRAASSLPQIVTALQGFNNLVIPDINGISSLGNSLKSFGSANAQKAATNLPILANGFRELITTLSSAPSVSSNTLRLAEAMAQIAASGGRASSTINSVSRSLAGYSTSANRAAKHSRSLASTIGTLYAKFFLVLRAFRAIGKAIGYASDMTEVANVVATTFGDATSDVQEFADTAIMSFGMAELSAKQYASRFQAMGVAMGVSTEQVASASGFLTDTLANNERAYTDLGDSMSDVSINLTKLTADMASFYNVDYADVAQDLESVFTGMTRPLRAYGLDLTEATLKEWAFKNGLDSNIESMTQAEKTMLRYQYVMANMGHVMGDFTKTADTWANVTRTIGQQFQKLGQIIGQGFINTFKPVLIGFRNFMNTLIDLTEKGLNAIGKLLGWQIEIEDVGTTMSDDAEDYASSIDDAADSAKKLLRLLLPIDELNLLPSDNDSGSGSGSSSVSGGGASSTLTGGGLTLVPYESDIESWYELGQKFAQKVTDGLNSIDWDSALEKAANFGKNLADLLNGAITPEMFYAVGRTIANAINTAITAAYSFGQEFDFENLGLSIAAGINGFFDNFNFADLANSIDTWVQGIWKTIKAALTGDENGDGGIDFETLRKGISEFFSEIDIETVALIIGFATIKSVGKWIIGGGIVKALGGALTSAIAKNGGIIATGKAIGQAIGGSSLVTGFTSAITGSGGLINFLTLDMSALVASGAASSGAVAGTAFVGGIVAAVGGWNLGQWINEKLTGEKIDMSFLEQMNVIKESFSDGTWKKALNLWGQDIYNGFSAAGGYIVELLQPVGNALKGLADNAKDAFGRLTENARLGVANLRISFSNLGQFLSGIWSSLKTSATTAWQGIKNTIGNAINAIKNFLNFDWKWPTIKTPHLSWTEGGASAKGVVKTILEALSLPTSLPKLNVEWYAEGGYPSMGSLFVANEAGPEMIGTIGGKTAVANNDQIVSAVSQGVAQAVASVMGGRNGNQTIQMVVDGKVLYQTVVNENNRQISRTGSSAIRT